MIDHLELLLLTFGKTKLFFFFQIEDVSLAQNSENCSLFYHLAQVTSQKLFLAWMEGKKASCFSLILIKKRN